MKTELDDCFELLLKRFIYEEDNLVVELQEQFVEEYRNIKPKAESRSFQVTFISVVSQLLIEEFAESVANLVESSETHFLRLVENTQLKQSLGLNVQEIYTTLNCYALITSHEILIVFCQNFPKVELK